MPNTVIALKKSSTPSAAPVDLANGELAINYADGKLFYKHANGTIAAISSGSDNFGSVSANGTLIVADTSGDILTIDPGTNISIVGDAINDKITIAADLTPALTQANTARVHANAAFASANAGQATANAAFDKANSTTYTSNVVIEVADNTNAALRITQTGIGDAIRIEDDTTPDSTSFVVNASGNVGIGNVTTTTTRLSVEYNNTIEPLSGSGSAFRIVNSNTATDSKSAITFWGNDAGGTVRHAGGIGWGKSGPWTAGGNNYDAYLALYTRAAGTNTVERMRVDANGNVGIGTTTPAYKLEVAGSFAAQTKSFVINHPTKPGMMLRHGSLEGPENGVYVRGRLDGKSIIELPDYWWNLIDESTITVNLTPIGRSQDIWVQSVSAYFIHLNQPAECFFTVFAERKDVDKLVVEY